MKEHFNNLGFEINGILHLSGRQALECIEAGALLVDVREDYEIGIKDFGITGKVECPVSNFENFMHTLPADRPLIIADCVGLHSKECVLKLLEKECCKRAFLAGIFLSGGSVNNPETSNYHLELSVDEEEYALYIQELIHNIEDYSTQIID